MFNVQFDRLAKRGLLCSAGSEQENMDVALAVPWLLQVFSF